MGSGRGLFVPTAAGSTAEKYVRSAGRQRRRRLSPLQRRGVDFFPLKGRRRLIFSAQINLKMNLFEIKKLVNFFFILLIEGLFIVFLFREG